MGLLFAVAKSRFLVTCRHSVHDVVARGAGLWIRDDRTSTAVALTPEFLFLNSNRFDLAVAKLPDSFVECLSDHQFARGVDTDGSDKPVGTPCVMHGVLSGESRTWDDSVTSEDQCLRAFTYVGHVSEHSSTTDSIDSSIYFALHGEPLTRNADQRSYGGMSGTPVFAVNGNPFQPNWKPTDRRIIGIQSSVVSLHKLGITLMKVARIELLYSLLRTCFPSDAQTLDALTDVVAKRPTFRN